MIGIVPLAGPDFERPDGTVKAEYPVDGLPLLRRALEGRPWWRSGWLKADDLIFVLRGSVRSRRFAAESLAVWYPGCRVVFISDNTAGAALSAACGLGLTADFDTPLIVDLCDILFDCDPAALSALKDRADVGGLAITFESDDAKYSYLECDADGRMTRSREKIVISSHASAGVYVFRSAPVYFEALAHTMRHRDSLAHNGLLYVCPMLNGVVAQGLTVGCIAARAVRDIRLPTA